MMMKNLSGILTIWLIVISHAGAQISGESVGNVTTTSFAVAWETDDATVPDVEVFSDAAGTIEITSMLKIERQSLIGSPRAIDGGTPLSRAKNRSVQAAMEVRRAFLVKISGAAPDHNYWVKAVARDQAGAVLHRSDLLAVTTAARADVIAESRQLLVDFASASVGVGDFTGVIIQLGNATSPYPLFAVINDGAADQQAYFDLSHFLYATGESQMVLTPGSTLDLTFSLLGSDLSGAFTGEEIAYDGSFVSARTSTAEFITDDAVVLSAIPERATALAGHPFSVNLSARDDEGQLLVGFNRTLTLTSPGLAGGSLSSQALENGLLENQDVILNTLGDQTVIVTDSGSPAETSFMVDVLEYTYDNYRLHFFGDLTSPEGEPSANNDGDDFDNTEEFVFGLDPEVNEGTVQYDLSGGSLLKMGGPDVVLRVDGNGVDLRVTFLRLKNHEALGINYLPQLSSSLATWHDVPTEPVVIAEEGNMELVSVPFPYFTPEPRKARFFRLNVSIP